MTIYKNTPCYTLKGSQNGQNGAVVGVHNADRVPRSVGRKSRKLFGPEEAFTKLPSACFDKPVFYKAFKET